MSEAQVDKILRKYDKPLRPTSELPFTQRKRESHSPHLVTFMDNYTPVKQAGTQIRTSPLDEYSGANASILRQLDMTEKKYILADRNYAEMARKYDRISESYAQLQAELERERKSRLEELIDVQNKLHVLQADNEQNLAKLKAKDHMVAILKEKLAQKEEQVAHFEQELEVIGTRLAETLQSKEKQSMNVLSSHIMMNNQESIKVIEGLKAKHEREIEALHAQVEKFSRDLLQKQKQKRQLLDNIQQITKLHIQQKREVKDTLAKNEQLYKSWLDDAKKQKLDLVQRYEKQIGDIRKEEFYSKVKKADNSLQQSSKAKQAIKQLEEKNIKLIIELKNNRSEIETLARADRENAITRKNLGAELQQIKVEYLHQVSQNKKMIQNLQHLEEAHAQINRRSSKLQLEVHAQKRRSQQILAQNKRLYKQIESLKSDMGKELRSLIHVKKQLSEASDSQLNMNSVLTQATTKLKTRIQALEEEVENLTTQLYAQRLQKAKIIEELEQTRIELRKQYDLSLQNTKKQLQEQIKTTFSNRNSEDVEKQKLYLQMFKLERQYELLKSEVITSDQMLKMGTKMMKYYKKKK